MLKMDNEPLSENGVVNSHNFLLNSDFFYAANYPEAELNNLNLDNYTNMGPANGSALLKTKSYSVKENSIIVNIGNSRYDECIFSSLMLYI